MTVTASEAAEYVHEMLEGLHAMATQPENHKLRFLIWQAIVEAKRVMDEVPLPAHSRAVRSPAEAGVAGNDS